MDTSTILFYIIALALIIFSVSVVLVPNPIYSALFLALAMITLAFVFFVLQAYFIAGVQLIVYAGAVMVLFVMVLMLFDLGKETEAFTKGRWSGVLKIASAGWLCGLIGGATYMSTDMILTGTASTNNAVQTMTTKDLSQILFARYLFSFEVLGLLLLLIAVGVVAVSRIKGGTHAKY